MNAETAQIDGQLVALEGLGSRIGKNVVALFHRQAMLRELRDTLPPTADAQVALVRGGAVVCLREQSEIGVLDTVCSAGQRDLFEACQARLLFVCIVRGSYSLVRTCLCVV